jgi:hypothetical protein
MMPYHLEDTLREYGFHSFARQKNKARVFVRSKENFAITIKTVNEGF